MNLPKLSIVIPLWNEEKNIDALVEMISKSPLILNGIAYIYLINNGSSDRTGELVKEYASRYSWVKSIQLGVNQNYGGGIQEGLKNATTEYLGFIPGDLQVNIQDVQKVWEFLESKVNETKNPRILVKGNRTVRKDGFNTRFVSGVYTFLANLILGLHVKDINALPKIFHRDLLSLLPSEKVKTFVFDSQVLVAAHYNKWPIYEVPVVFHARREGISSWSGKRIQVYINSFKLLFKVRKLALDDTNIKKVSI